MNYIKHLNLWMELVAVDDRLTPHHISIYLALFQQWNKQRFPSSMFICRHEIMQAGKIGSTRTYYKCLNALHDFGYIVYAPSRCPIKGSKVSINPLEDFLDDQANTSQNEGEIVQEQSSSTPANSAAKDWQNGPILRCKSDTSGNHLVTPLLKHNRNILNCKQREGRTRDLKLDEVFSFQKAQHKKNESTALEIKKTLSIPEISPPSSPDPGEKLESHKKGEAPRKFSVPTPEEVKKFFTEMTFECPSGKAMGKDALEMEASKFYQHYESNGWLVGGKSPMRNWKAGIRSWMAKAPFFNRKPIKTHERKNYHVEKQQNYAKPL